MIRHAPRLVLITDLVFTAGGALLLAVTGHLLALVWSIADSVATLAPLPIVYLMAAKPRSLF